MSYGLRVASWIFAISLVVICNGALVAVGFLGEFFDSDVYMLSEAAYAISDAVVAVIWVIVPIIQVCCIVFAIIAATRKDSSALLTTRSIMLTIKLGLIPFFIAGGAVIATLFIAGFHPVLVGITWGMGLVIGVMGWFTVITGSTWAIATAVHLRRMGVVSAGELAVHIIAQFFFVADVVDAIVLFARSSDAAKSLRSGQPQYPEQPQPIQQSQLVQQPQQPSSNSE